MARSAVYTDRYLVSWLHQLLQLKPCGGNLLSVDVPLCLVLVPGALGVVALGCVSSPCCEPDASVMNVF